MKWLQFLTPVKSIDTREAKTMMDQATGEGIIILDVRQPNEYEAAHIPGATLIPLPQLGDRLAEVDRTKPVLIYCASGGRSRVAAQMMAGHGYDRIYNVSGGIKAWQSNTAVGPQDLGLHLFSGKETPEEVLEAAYSLEQGLQSFYSAMAGQAGVKAVASLFEKLAGIEVKHQASIVDAYRDLGHPEISMETLAARSEGTATEGGMSTQEYLDLYQPDLDNPAEIVGLAMAIEAQAQDLYQRVGAKLSDERAKKIVLKIADEEKVHLASLGKLMDSL